MMDYYSEGEKMRGNFDDCSVLEKSHLAFKSIAHSDRISHFYLHIEKPQKVKGPVGQLKAQSPLLNNSISNADGNPPRLFDAFPDLGDITRNSFGPKVTTRH